jgi:hypothetical protein
MRIACDYPAGGRANRGQSVLCVHPSRVFSAPMGAAGTSASGRRTIRLLDYDPTLGSSLRPERMAEAHATAEATVVEVGRGVRTLDELADGEASRYGILLLDGLVNRTVVLDGVVSAQLLGSGDLVRVAPDAR